MDSTQHDATGGEPPLESAIDAFLDSGQKSGNYRDGLERVLADWRQFLRERHDVTSVGDVTKRDLAAYASHLAERVGASKDRTSQTDGITAGTAWTYYDYVSAFLSWSVKWEYLADNPAQKGVAIDEMPPRPTAQTDDADFWSTQDRRQLLSYADRRVDDALDERGLDAIEELRDRALVYVLAYSGVRGGEVLSDPRDDRRDGLRWDDVALEDGYLTVLGKNQTTEQVQLPEQARGPLKRLRTALQPTDGAWPVFPTAHAPTLATGLPDDIDRTGDESWLECYRRVETAPASLSTNGGRTVLKRLCEAAEIDVDGEYLKPHGARRGVGELVYRERGPAAAQRTLRHADPQTTSQMYAHIEAAELADEVGDVFRDDEVPDKYK